MPALIKSIVVLVMLTTALQGYAADKDDISAQCREQLIQFGVESSESIKKIEHLYLLSAWQHRKWRHIIYRPLWDALQTMKDPFSIGIQAEGEVRFTRYQQMAQSYLGAKDDNDRAILKEIQLLQHRLNGITDYCPSLSYHDCLTPWKTDTEKLLAQTEQLFKEMQSRDVTLNTLVQKTIFETPSEHDLLEERMTEWRDQRDKIHEPALLALVLELMGQYEYQLPQHCAAQCSISNIARSQDSELGTAGIRPNKLKAVTKSYTYDKLSGASDEVNALSGEDD